MMSTPRLTAAAVVAALTATAAHAETCTQLEARGYVSAMGTYTIADSDRSTDDLEHASGLSLLYGRAFKDSRFGYELAFDYDDYETGSVIGIDFYRYRLGADLTYSFGDRTGFTPFVLAGLGGARNDVVPNSEDSYDWTGNVGIGFVTGPVTNAGQIRLRGEARYVYDDFQDGYAEPVFGLGIEIPLFAEHVVEIAPPAPVTNTVEVPTGLADADGDGVVDDKDQCPDTPTGTRVDGDGCALQKVINLEGVTFEFNKTRLRPDARTILNNAVAILKKYPDMLVEIAGHTDNIGSDSFNQKLSEGRAQAVKDYFVANGVPESQMSVHGYGESQPIASNDTEDGREQNRRVELRIQN